MTVHWGIEDPAKVEGAGQEQAFQDAMIYLNNRISLFLALPLKTLDRFALRKRLREIGNSKDKELTAA